MVTRLFLGIVIGAALGGLLGYAGKLCQGSCPFMKNPFRAALYGAVWGLLVSWISFYR